MQYILTEQEYKALLESKSKIRLSDEDLQNLCTKIAKQMPAYRQWEPSDASPWGCIIEQGGYCDCCPVVDICPYPNKDFSK